MTPTIPTGWRKLRKGTVIRKGDKYWHPESKTWSYAMAADYIVGRGSIKNFIYIRRKKGKG